MTSKLDAYRTSVFGDEPSIISNNEEKDANFQNYLRQSSTLRASISRRDLQQHTDMKFFISSNFANLISFIAVLAVSICLGWIGWGRDVKGTYKELSSKYETLLTPVFWFIPISWCLVWIAEAVFIASSFMKNFSHLPIVQQAVGFNFFYINVCQIGWIVSYCLGVVWLATAWMGAIVVLLIWLNYNLYYQQYIRQTPQSSLDMDQSAFHSMTDVYEWLLFRMPFQIHFGWAFFALLVNVSETSMELDWPFRSEMLLIFLIVLWLLGLFVLFYPKSPIIAIPLILAWALFGVWMNIREPSEAVLKAYDSTTIRRMYGGVIATCIEHLIISLIRFVVYFASSYSLLEKEYL